MTTTTEHDQVVEDLRRALFTMTLLGVSTAEERLLAGQLRELKARAEADGVPAAMVWPIIKAIVAPWLAGVLAEATELDRQLWAEAEGRIITYLES